MADTSIQKEVERWIVKERLPKIFGRSFSKRKIKLKWGGSFEVDALSDDKEIAVCISTSTRKTARGKNAQGKFHKIRSDALFLLHAKGISKRVLAFTDPEMLLYFEEERLNGRFPSGNQILLQHVRLPPGISIDLEKSRNAASREVTREK